MRGKISGLFTIGRRFRKEFRNQLRLLIIVTLGFTIAFTWRQTTFDISQNFVRWLIDVKGDGTLSILTSLFITLFSVILIYIASYFLKDTIDDC